MMNKFMKEYKEIVEGMMTTCVKKNNDYGSSVEDTYNKFGDVSYLVRITDKYNRILGLIYLDNENINEYMLKFGGCEKYIELKEKRVVIE